MIPVALVVNVARLASAVLRLVPEPDPELHRQRARHAMEMRKLREQHQHERILARIERRRA